MTRKNTWHNHGDEVRPIYGVLMTCNNIEMRLEIGCSQVTCVEEDLTVNIKKTKLKYVK